MTTNMGLALTKLAFFMALLEIVTNARPEKPRVRLALQIQSFKMCKDTSQHFNMSHFSVDRAKNGVTFVNADFYNQKEMKSMSKLVFSMTACKDGVSYNTCEYTGAWTYTVGLCQLVVSSSMPWTSFVSAIRPPLRCPMPAGRYAMRNGTINMDALEKIGNHYVSQDIFGKVFVTELRCYNEKQQLHVCMVIAANFIQLRG